MEVDAVHAIAIPKAFRAELASNWPWSLGSNKTIGKRGLVLYIKESYSTVVVW